MKLALCCALYTVAKEPWPIFELITYSPTSFSAEPWCAEAALVELGVLADRVLADIGCGREKGYVHADRKGIKFEAVQPLACQADDHPNRSQGHTHPAAVAISTPIRRGNRHINALANASAWYRLKLPHCHGGGAPPPATEQSAAVDDGAIVASIKRVSSAHQMAHEDVLFGGAPSSLSPRTLQAAIGRTARPK